jgi:hypothetical protein
MFILPSVFVPLIVWSVRFAMLHQMKFLKGALFSLTALTLFSIFYFFASYIVSMTMIGV